MQELGITINRECDTIRNIARKRAEIIFEKEEQEREVARLGELLAPYKREVGNCQTAAREHQQEADNLIREAGEKLKEAKILEDRARRLEEEADRLF